MEETNWLQEEGPTPPDQSRDIKRSQIVSFIKSSLIFIYCWFVFIQFPEGYWNDPIQVLLTPLAVFPIYLLIRVNARIEDLVFWVILFSVLLLVSYFFGGGIDESDPYSFCDPYWNKERCEQLMEEATYGK